MNPVQFWNSSYLRLWTHKDVLGKLENSLTGLNPSKMIQVSIDRPSGNVKFLESVQFKRERRTSLSNWYWCLSTTRNAWSISNWCCLISMEYSQHFESSMANITWQPSPKWLLYLCYIQVQHHSFIISVLQDGLKVKTLRKKQSHFGSMWLKL